MPQTIKFLIFLSFLVFPFNAVGELTPTYVGTKRCMMCHISHYDAWSENRMSQAYEILKPGVRAEAKQKADFDPAEDYTESEYCLSCHVTGYDEPGGFTSIEETPDMAGVQCEACHGPGSIYSEMMIKKAGTYYLFEFMEKGALKMPDEENHDCAEMCHNDGSPFVDPEKPFDFNERAKSGVHKVKESAQKGISMPFDL